jgi:hypothetical protein
MAKRAAFLFVALVIGVIQLLRFSASPQTPELYVLGFAPAMPKITSQPRHIAPYMMAPKTKTIHNVEIEEATKEEVLKVLDASDLQDIQRTVLVSLFRISKKEAIGRRSELPTMKEVLADPSGEEAIHAAAYEVFFIARDLFGGPVKDFVDTCLKSVTLTTKDAEKRVEILDTCFYAFPAEYKDTPVEDGLRLFRMLLAPRTANLANAKKDVRAQTTKLNRRTAASVEKWMHGMEAGKGEFYGPNDFVEDCLNDPDGWDLMDVWMPIMPRKKQATQSRSDSECFTFEEALRNYKAVVLNLEAFDL